jgi:hypothetical protein
MAQYGAIGAKREDAMSDNPFISVKLPSRLVNEARETAQTMRRSVASQIEYWATLGRALESAGLTANDSQALIVRQERAPYKVTPLPDELDDLHTHVVTLAKTGALADRAQTAIENKAKSARRKPGAA